LPHLERLFKEYGKRGVAGVTVNFGDKAETIRAYFEKEKFTMTPVRQQKDEVSRRFGVRAYPTNYVIDAEGKVAWRAVGFDEAGLRSALEKIAPEK
jgi:thiol-disulfide isomerase/thioredoxin